MTSSASGTEAAVRLSVKLALLTCFGFTFGMCWLVSLVARPIVEMPTPLIVRGPGLEAGAAAVLAADLDSHPVTRGRSPVVAGRFARSSPVEVEAPASRSNADLLVVAEALPQDMYAEPQSLPPLVVPEAPLIAQADQRAAGGGALLGGSGPEEAETSIPEAIVADLPGHGLDLLLAASATAEPGPTAAEREAGTFGIDGGGAALAVRQYKVQSGDTLVKIMRREWNSDDQKLRNVLLTANPQVAKRPDLIFAGEVLNIPDLESARQADRGDSGADSEIYWYTIRQRDSLVKIARRMLNDERRWREIAELNRLRNADRILPGTRIKLPPIDRDT